MSSVNQVAKTQLCVDIVVINRDTKEILFIERGKEPFKGLLALPGGRVNVQDGEAADQAASRELKEETNLDCKDMIKFTFRASHDRDPRCYTTSLFYLTYTTNGMIQNIKAGDDAVDIRWVNPHDVIHNKVQLAFDHADVIWEYWRRPEF